MDKDSKSIYSAAEIALFMLQGAAFAAIPLFAVWGFIAILDLVGEYILPDEARSGRAASIELLIETPDHVAAA